MPDGTEMVGQEENLPEKKWRTNPEDVRYAEHFGDMIRELGIRYDGHPALESVDLSIVGAWGEGAGRTISHRQVKCGVAILVLKNAGYAPCR
jgi:hypothetical protein